MRRSELIDELTRSITAHEWTDCIDACFMVLFGLPGAFQIGVAGVMMSRYVPVLEERFPGVTWPRQLLDDPGAWVERSGRSVPDDPELSRSSDVTFLSAVDGLLLACVSPADELLVTSSSVYAIDMSIHAQMQNVWESDDPGAVVLWRRMAAPEDDRFDEALRDYRGRSPEENAASVAVRQREWKRLVEILTARGILEFPQTQPSDTIEDALHRWKERECSLLLPLA
jgi:hypothetical protein